MTLLEQTRPLRRGLAGLRRRARSLLMVLGISRVVTLLVVVLVTFFFADYFLRLPMAVRTALALGSLGVLTFVAYRRLLRPLSRPMSDQMLAARVEAAHPELENRLSSSIAFGHAEKDPENEDSPALMHAVVEETAEMVSSIRFGDVARSKTTSRWAAVSIGLLIAMSAGAVANADQVATFVQRSLLLRDIPWPRRTTLDVVDMRPGEPRRVTRGGETTVTVQASGWIPDRVRFTWWERGRSRRSVESVDLTPSSQDPSIFTITMPVYASYEFTVSGGDDDRGLVYAIEALTPPAILRIEMDCVYPKYLEREDETLVNGDQRVPEGAQLVLRVKANMALASATITLGKDAPVAMRAISDDTYTIPLEASKDVRYSLRLVGPDGEENDPAADSFVLRVVKDQAPTVRVHTPVPYIQRVERGVVLLSFTARDDYNVASARLHYKVNDGKERIVAVGESGGDAVRLLFPAAREPEAILALAVLDLGRLRSDKDTPLQKGDTLTCYIDATDSAGKTERTRNDYVVTIVPEGDITQRAENLQNTLRETAERTDEQAANAMVAVQEVRSHRGGDADEFRRWSARAQATQARLISNLDSLARNIRNVLNLYVFNRLDNETVADQMLPYYERHLLADRDRVRAAFGSDLYRGIWTAQQERAIRALGALAKLIEMADLSDRLAVDHGPRAYRSLGRIHRGGSGNRAEALKTAIDDAVSEQKLILDGLARLTRLMREWQSYEGVVRFFKHLRDRQKGFEQQLQGLKEAQKSGDD